MKRRKVPIRKCVVSQKVVPKDELIRIVRSPAGEVMIDLTGKKSGRGAYLLKDVDIVQQAKEKNSLAQHLKVKIDDNIYIQLLELIESERTP